MTTTTLHLPDDLTRDEFAAESRGISLDGVICDSLRLSLGQVTEADPLVTDQAVFRGDIPRDPAASDDDYLYGDDS